MVTHELKTDPVVFDAVADGSKTHEIRYDDRNYAVGDVLILRRTLNNGWAMKNTGAPLEYTGHEFRAVVTHVLRGYGLEPGWVILSIKPDGVMVPHSPEAISQQAMYESPLPPAAGVGGPLAVQRVPAHELAKWRRLAGPAQNPCTFPRCKGGECCMNPSNAPGVAPAQPQTENPKC